MYELRLRRLQVRPRLQLREVAIVCGAGSQPAHGAAKSRTLTDSSVFDEVQVGLPEVVAAAKKRLPSHRSCRVCHAIAEIQSGWMASLTEAPKCVDRSLPVKIRERDDLDSGLFEKPQQQAGGVFLKSAREDQSGFRRGR
jgi:hypothetical protein